MLRKTFERKKKNPEKVPTYTNNCGGCSHVTSQWVMIDECMIKKHLELRRTRSFAKLEKLKSSFTSLKLT